MLQMFGQVFLNPKIKEYDNFFVSIYILVTIIVNKKRCKNNRIKRVDIIIVGTNWPILSRIIIIIIKVVFFFFLISIH